MNKETGLKIREMVLMFLVMFSVLVLAEWLVSSIKVHSLKSTCKELIKNDDTLDCVIKLKDF